MYIHVHKPSKLLYIICCHSLCVLLFFSQDYQRVPLLNFSEKYLGDEDWRVWCSTTSHQLWSQMSRIGHDVGIWWILMVFKYQSTWKQDHHFGIERGWEPKSLTWDLRFTEAVNVLTSLRLHAPWRLMGLGRSVCRFDHSFCICGIWWQSVGNEGSRILGEAVVWICIVQCVNTDSSLRSHVTTAVNMMQPT